MYLKFFWTLVKNVHCQGPCSLRPCISRPYCSTKQSKSAKIGQIGYFSLFFLAELQKVYPYYFTFTTFTKGRWVGERILDVFAREFRAHPAEEYVSTFKQFDLQELKSKKYVHVYIDTYIPNPSDFCLPIRVYVYVRIMF